MDHFTESNPWIKERETILCGWKPDYNRGRINNMNMNLSVDWYSFSNRQIKEYARMLKACGFTGVQITDDCSHWCWYNNYEPCHDKMKVLAQALREEGMKVTLWVWAAEFVGYGWVDHTVRYTAKNGGKAYDDPEVFATFNKYYDIYAEFAPYVDRLILHFFDPGELTDIYDIVHFAKLIEGKFRAVNPDIEMGIDTWSCPSDYPKQLIEAGLEGYMLMEVHDWSREKRRAYREGVKKLGSKLGVWSWYLADMEIDQSAWMVVNAKVEKDVYNRVRREGDDIMVPEYWSEMDSYHVMNMFSLYCAGHLLINPDDDPDRLVHDIAYKVYGEKYGKIVETALQVIQDARSGSTWEEYWWTYPPKFEPIYDPKDIVKRASESLAEMKTVAADKNITTDFPLPITPSLLAELTLPHLEQIMHYAQFLVDLEGLEKMLRDGASKEALYNELDRIWMPIRDYNTIIGVWGQRESRVQTMIVADFCKRAGIEHPRKALFDYTMKKRYYEYYVAVCKLAGRDTIWKGSYEASLPFPSEEDRILRELEKDGLITIVDKDNIRINDYDAYIYT